MRLDSGGCGYGSCWFSVGFWSGLGLVVVCVSTAHGAAGLVYFWFHLGVRRAKEVPAGASVQFLLVVGWVVG